MSQPTVVVLDYGSGNVRSAVRALEHAGADVMVSRTAEDAESAEGVVIPGVGAFAACMESLVAIDAGEMVDRRVTQGRAVLGICVGMQVMFEQGVEHGVQTLGFGRWPGVVELLDAPILPHMGWNTVEAGQESRLFTGIERERFYFVHSYGVRSWTPAPRDLAAVDRSPVLTWSRHDGPFLAAIEDGVLTATQFHPEKSGQAGHLLLRNWLATL